MPVMRSGMRSVMRSGMRPITHVVSIVVVALYCGAAVAVGPEPLGIADARHLLARTGFGAAHPDRIATFAGLDRTTAVARLLDGIRREAITPMPTFYGGRTFARDGHGGWRAPVDRREDGGANMADGGIGMMRAPFAIDGRPLLEAITACRQATQDCDEAAKWWWYQEMLATPSPFTERMVLFWHGHFTSSLESVGEPHYLLRQNAMLRDLAFGDFRTLVVEVIRDPAMLIYLCNDENTVDGINENFARELLELFTMGEGKYSERDVREATRALTGIHVDFRTGTAVFSPERHDHGMKTILGQSGRFGMDDLVDLILADDATARFIVTRLWRTFVSPDPDPAELDRLAAVFRTSGYRIDTLMEALLLSDAFWAPANRGRLIKSPTDLMVGTLRAAGIRDADAVRHLPTAGRLAGKDPLDPPRVDGWPGHTQWISTAAQVWRDDFLRRFAGMGGGTFAAVAAGPGNTETGVGDGLVARLAAALEAAGEPDLMLMAVPPVVPTPAWARDRQAVVRHLLLDPAFQVY